MTNQEERRHYRRIENQFNVRIARDVKGEELNNMGTDVAKSVNISGNGILICIKKPLDVKEIIRITFLKPNTFEFFEDLVRVVRIDENQDESFMVGLHFFNLPASETRRLDYYINMRPT
ncbi:MAG: hypothetical protein A2176_04520 [Spirochaetes bacterium RBG_13_51_14]|nr:MAG: hypothetical protein A2176_04520 [Spirochaetes bacterium RBG_13_51_14]